MVKCLRLLAFLLQLTLAFKAFLRIFPLGSVVRVPFNKPHGASEILSCLFQINLAQQTNEDL